jgi:predicted esterase
MDPMRWLLLTIALVCWAIQVPAKERVHVVASGHTLGKIAKRYHVSISNLCKANGIGRRDVIKPGQKLVIPDGSTKPKAPAKKSASKADTKKDEPKPDKKDDAVRRVGSDGMKLIDVPGGGSAYFYEPTGRGRLSLRPVIMYLHGRGGNPAGDCRRWAKVARRRGWLVCPTGPGARGGGRDWQGNWAAGMHVAVKTVQALRKRYGRRVQLYGNTLIGFSEGAYVAMNVGVRQPRTFNRWLILAGKVLYFGGPGLDALARNRRTLRRVYLITGEQDEVVSGTRELRERLRKAGVATRMSTPNDMGHEVKLESKASMYRAALMWLERGTTRSARVKTVAKRGSSSKRKR